MLDSQLAKLSRCASVRNTLASTSTKTNLEDLPSNSLPLTTCPKLTTTHCLLRNLHYLL